jgi:hypothetical protein
MAFLPYLAAELVIRHSVYIGKTSAPCLHKNSAFVSILFLIFKHILNLSASFIFIQISLYRLYMLCRLPTGANDSTRPACLLLNFSTFKQSTGWLCRVFGKLESGFAVVRGRRDFSARRWNRIPRVSRYMSSVLVQSLSFLLRSTISPLNPHPPLPIPPVPNTCLDWPFLPLAGVTSPPSGTANIRA